VVPNTVNKAHALDKVNENALWTDAIAKEMKNIRVAFDIKEGDEKAPSDAKRSNTMGSLRWLRTKAQDGGRRPHNQSS
jgi:hypothetical protein